ncbi:MAG: hypothetical protein K2Y22_00485 [Candidatus Obscuribacterales bacterium]|nr:hypothetical protein [Candidatus Obscuribacterales bacterium]
MGRQDDEIQRKLNELEASLDYSTNEDEAKTVLKVPESTQLSTTGIGSELNIFIGLGLLLTSVLMFFNHVKVGSGWLSWLGFGGQGFGLVVIPLLIGLGLIFYNSKSKVGWIVTAASCALIFFAVLSQLVMTFPTISFLGLIMMLLPLALGVAMLMKGLSAKSDK